MHRGLVALSFFVPAVSGNNVIELSPGGLCLRYHFPNNSFLETQLPPSVTSGKRVSIEPASRSHGTWLSGSTQATQPRQALARGGLGSSDVRWLACVCQLEKPLVGGG